MNLKSIVLVFSVAHCSMYGMNAPMEPRNHVFVMVNAKSDAQVLREYLNEHADAVGQIDTTGKTPLYYAVIRNNVAKARALLDYGADYEAVLQFAEIRRVLALPAYANMNALMRTYLVVPVEQDPIAKPIELDQQMSGLSSPQRSQGDIEGLLEDTALYPANKFCGSQGISGRSYKPWMKVGLCVAGAGALWWYLSKEKPQKPERKACS